MRCLVVLLGLASCVAASPGPRPEDRESKRSPSPGKLIASSETKVSPTADEPISEPISEPAAKSKLTPVDLPSTTSDVPLSERSFYGFPVPTILVAVDGVAYAGRTYRSSDTGGAMPELRIGLDLAVRTARETAELRGVDEIGSVVIRADAGATAASVVAVARTATDAGWEGALLAAHRPTEVRDSALHLELNVPDYTRLDAPVPRVSISATQFTIGAGPDAETHPLDFDVLERWALEHSTHEGQHAVHLDVSPSVPLQSLVSAMDALRGRSCRMAGAYLGEAVPPDCQLWRQFVHVAD